MASGMQVRVLGPVDVTIDGVASPIRGLRRKAVLAVLALHPGEVVSSSRLVDLVWGETPPATATNVLQRYISFLRSDLGAPGGIVARSAGYILNVPVDAAGIRQVIQSSARDEQLRDHALAASRLRAALDLWRGPSLVDVTEVGWLRDQARRLDELRLNGTERLIEARLALGEHQSVVPELERLAAEHPFREHLYKLWMLTLYRCGRQADALAVFQRLRRTLDDELGIRPGPALRELQAAILRQDASLDLPAPAVETSPVSSRRVAPAQLPHDV